MRGRLRAGQIELLVELLVDLAPILVLAYGVAPRSEGLSQEGTDQPHRCLDPRLQVHYNSKDYRESRPLQESESLC